MAHALKSLELLEGFSKSFVKARWRWGGESQGAQSACAQFSDWLIARVMSRGLAFSVHRLQEAWGYVLMVIKQFFCLRGRAAGHICKTTQEMCIKYSYLGISQRS